MQKIDLKALAKELKQAAAQEESKPGEQQGRQSIAIKKSQVNKTKGKTALKSIIQDLNQRTDFEFKHHIYVDEEIYEILRQIKTRTKLKLGNLASVLLEDFILEHKSEVIALLKMNNKRLI
jgi:hypothetical protein